MAVAGELDGDEVVVAGTGHLQVAPYGATLPTNLDVLSLQYFDVGYTAEDGVELTLDRQDKPIAVWQSVRPVRRIIVSQEESIKCDLMQWNETNIVIAFGGGTVVSAGSGLYQYNFPEAGSIDERTVVLDWTDEDKDYRLIIPKCTVTGKVTTKLTRNDASMLPVEFHAQDTAPYIITNDPAFAADS